MNWGLKARGGYIEILLLGTILFMLAHRLMESREKPDSAQGHISERRQKAAAVLNVLIVFFLAVAAFIAASGGAVINTPLVRISMRNYHNPAVIVFLLWCVKCAVIMNRQSAKAVWNGQYARLIALTGLVTGLAWWTNQLAIFYILPAGAIFMIRERKNILNCTYQLFYGAVFALTLFIGGLPYWLHQIGGDSAQPQFYAALASPSTAAAQLRHYFTAGMPVILGCAQIRSFPDPEFYPAALILLLHAAAFIYLGIRIMRKQAGGWRSRLDRLGTEEMLFLSLLIYPVIFASSSAGWFITEPRYLLPLYSVLPVMLGSLLAVIQKKNAAFFLVCAGLVIAFPLYEFHRTDMKDLQPWVAARRLPLSFDGLMDFMRGKNLDAAYADYWIAYRLTFESQENITATVYPPWQKNRHVEYNKIVDAAANPAYILMETQQEFNNVLGRMGIDDFKTEPLGNFLIYYDIKLPRQPAERIPYTPDGKWKPYSNYNQREAMSALDNNPSTRWTSGTTQEEGIFYEIDFGREKLIGGVEISPGANVHDYPRGLLVEFRSDGSGWETAAKYEDITRVMHELTEIKHPLVLPAADLVIEFAPVKARRIRLTTLREDGKHWWSISTLRVFKPAD